MATRGRGRADTLGGEYSEALGINDSGVVGSAERADGTVRAVRWAGDGTITDLDTLPDTTVGTALAINDAGVIVGQVLDSNDIPHAVRWDADGTVIDLGALTTA